MSQAQDADYQPKPKVLETPERVGEGFDLRTHISDAKTGGLVRVQPYRLFCQERIKYYERPKLSGNLYFEDGKEAGRRTKTAEGAWVIDTKAAHVDFTAAKSDAITPDQVFAENEELRKELAAMKAEKEAMLEQKNVKAQAQAAPKK